MTTISLSAIYPEIVLTVFSLIILLLQSLNGARFKGFYGYLSLIAVLAATGLVVSQPSSFAAHSVEYSFSGMWVVDNYARFFKLIFLLGTLLTLLISMKYVEDEGLQQGEFFALILFATIGMMIEQWIKQPSS